VAGKQSKKMLTLKIMLHQEMQASKVETKLQPEMQKKTI